MEISNEDVRRVHGGERPDGTTFDVGTTLLTDGDVPRSPSVVRVVGQVGPPACARHIRRAIGAVPEL
jgi:hypothetical protein